MDDKTLVAYGTKYGATAEIAEKIGDVLRHSGLTVDVMPVSRVGDLAPYGSVVLGSALYIGKWRKDAAQFLRDNAGALAQKPVWIFSSGPTEDGDPVELLKGERVPKTLQEVVDSIQPQDTAVFGGYNNAEKMSGLDKWMIKKVGHSMGDFRNWDAITAWASSVAGQIRPAV